MKKNIVILALLLSCPAASADEWVNGYLRQDGTYVSGHIRSSPDSIQSNNYSAQPKTYGRTEYSQPKGNKNPAYDYKDNDKDGLINRYDPKPDSRNNYGFE